MDAALAPIDRGMDVERIIDEICDAQSAKEAAQNVDKLKKLLELADQYGDYAKQFCMAEARVYIRIADIEGAEDLLAEGKRALVGWIRRKTQAEMETILAEVADGTRITTIKNRETRALTISLKEQAITQEYQRISKDIIEAYDLHGRTSVAPSEFYSRWSLSAAPVDKETAKAYTEKTRDVILRRGGVGIADGMGTYVDPDTSDRAELGQAIAERLTSIHRDMHALADICERSSFVIPQKGLNMLRQQLERLESL